MSAHRSNVPLPDFFSGGGAPSAKTSVTLMTPGNRQSINEQPAFNVHFQTVTCIVSGAWRLALGRGGAW